MATVRIYKVAELLNLSSQDVMALLKKEHGIEVKSASSTIEEVVAREFVTKQARQRNLKVPSAAALTDTSSPVTRGVVKKPGGKAEPAKPPAPVMPAPRLVKTAKPAAPPAPLVETPTPAPLTPEPIVIAPEPAHVETPAPPGTSDASEPASAASGDSFAICSLTSAHL